MAKTTSTRKKTPARKPRSSTAKSAPAPAVEEPPVTQVRANVVAARPVTVTQPSLRKPDLIDAVIARTDAKKSVAKPIVEAVLAVLGETVAAERELNMPPFGKLKIQRVKDTSDARITVAKLRQPKPEPSD